MSILRLFLVCMGVLAGFGLLALGLTDVNPLAPSGSPTSTTRETTHLSQPPAAAPIEASREEVRISEANPPTTSNSSSTPQPRAFIRGMVVDPGHRPVSPAGVELWRGRRSIDQTTVDGDGRFEFHAPLGQYELRVSDEGLSRLYVPPFRQNDDTRLMVEAPQGSMATSVTLMFPGEEQWAELRVNYRNPVSGYIYTFDGMPVKDAMVRLQNLMPGLEKFGFDAQSDEFGYYEIESLPPGDYRQQVFLPKGHPQRELAKPILENVRVDNGPQMLHPIFLGSGAATISGRVVDQNNEPFAGLGVLIYLNEDVPPGTKPHDWNSSIATTTTGADGTWQVSNLPEAKVAVQVGFNAYEPGRANNVLQTFVRPRYVNLHVERSVTLGTISAIRASR